MKYQPSQIFCLNERPHISFECFFYFYLLTVCYQNTIQIHLSNIFIKHSYFFGGERMNNIDSKYILQKL